MNIVIQEETTKNPLQLIGKEAGTCWGADTEDADKNLKRGLSCMKSGHMRTAEFPQIYITIDGYSARVIREFYTHIAGGPTRLQASTRYIDYEHGFKYIVPPTISKDSSATLVYLDAMDKIQEALRVLDDLKIPREDSANLLPLGMTTKIVCRTNARHLIDMCQVRLCNRAYWEFRILMKDILKALSEYSEEWKIIVDEFCKPKCEVMGYCNEEKSCGRKPKQNASLD